MIAEKGDQGIQGIQGVKGDPGDISNIKVDGAAKTKAAGVVDLTSDFARYALWRKTSSANPVSVYPMPESPLYPKVSGTYTQAGTGGPSPDNIRPITPWLASGAQTKVKRTGKNMLNLSTDGIYIVSAYANMEDAKPIFLANRVLWGASASGYLSPAGAGPYSTNPLTGDAELTTALAGYGLCFRVDALPNKAYCFNTAVNVGCYGKDFTYLSHTSSVSSITTPSNTAYILVSLVGPVGVATKFKALQMELGSTATPYEPYSGQEITLTAPQEIPAGWLDNERQGQATWAKKIITGTEPSWVVGQRLTNTVRIDYYAYLTGGLLVLANKIACSHFNPLYGDQSDTEHSRNAATAEHFIFYINKSRLTGWSDAWSNAQIITAVKAWLAAQYSAGTPVTVAYQLATPASITPTIAPLSSLPQLDRITPRQNVLTATPASGIELTYAKSPIQESIDVAAAIV